MDIRTRTCLERVRSWNLAAVIAFLPSGVTFAGVGVARLDSRG